jgi:hypothetical protein
VTDTVRGREPPGRIDRLSQTKEECMILPQLYVMDLPDKSKGKRRRHSHPKRQTLSVRLLDEIEARGDDGMTVSEMSKLLWQWRHPDVPYDKKKGRTRWCLHFYRGGLLRFYCEHRSGGGRRWFRKVGVHHGGHPFATMNRFRKAAAKAWHANFKLIASTPALPSNYKQIIGSCV